VPMRTLAARQQKENCGGSRAAFHLSGSRKVSR
jgi:hypothetical protein